MNGRDLQVGTEEFTIGEPGDLVAVGDWDGDGWSTPAVLQRRSKVVYLFDDWPSENPQLTGRRFGHFPGANRISVERQADGTDRVVVSGP